MEEYTGKEISSPYLSYTIKGEQAMYIPDKLKSIFYPSTKLQEEPKVLFINKVSKIASVLDGFHSFMNNPTSTNTAQYMFFPLEYSFINMEKNNNSPTTGYIEHIYRIYDQKMGIDNKDATDGVLLRLDYIFKYLSSDYYLYADLKASLLRDTGPNNDYTVIGKEYDLKKYKEARHSLKDNICCRQLNNEIVSDMVKDISIISSTIRDDYDEIIDLAYRINNTIRNFIDAVNKDGEYVKKDDES